MLMSKAASNSAILTKFKECYLEFARAMLAETNKRYVSSEQSLALRREFQFSEGEYSVNTRSVAMKEWHIPSWKENEFPEAIADRCAEQFHSSGLASGIRLSDNSGARILNPDFERLRPSIVEMELRWPLHHLVRLHGRTSFSKRQILTCLDKYIEHWQGRSATDPEFAPLFNFETEIKAIRLDDFVSIVPFGDDYKSRIMNALGTLDRTMDMRHFASASHAVKLASIDCTHSNDRKKEIKEHARRVLQCAVTSLRLLKPELVGTLGYILNRRLTGHLGAGIRPLEDLDLPANRNLFPHDRYVFDRASLGQFRSLYRTLSCNQFERWELSQLPLRQFNRACQRLKDEDRILDYSICLESTLLSGVRSELSYRLALRAAKLLFSQRNPKETFDRIRCLYEVRSKIVHGNCYIGSKGVKDVIMKQVAMQPGEFMLSTDLLMRQLLPAIVRRVSRQCTFAKLGKRLDDEIILSL